MKSLILTIALAILAAQSPPMPPPGNPDHQEPAPGAFCRHDGPGVDADHACACQPTCMEDRDGNGEPTGGVTRQEDNVRCRAACHPKHCQCVSNCEP